MCQEWESKKINAEFDSRANHRPQDTGELSLSSVEGTFLYVALNISEAHVDYRILIY